MHKKVMKTVPKKEKEGDDSLHLAFDDKPTIVGTIVDGNIRQSVELLVFCRHFSKIFPNPQTKSPQTVGVQHRDDEQGRESEREREERSVGGKRKAHENNTH
jgi:hypothetical protein